MGKKVILNKYIIREGTLSEMGKKAYNLNLLKRRNIKVPDFYCFNSRAFEEAQDFRKKEYLEKIATIDFEDEESISSVSKEIINKIKQIRCFEFEDKINVFLREKFDESALFRIRSSSTYEDMDAYGNKRLFEHFINVKRDEVFEHIRKCWESVYSVDTLKYLHENSIDIKDVRMGVIIQEMKKEGLSGIAFTSNPKGLLNELIVVVGDGTSEDIAQKKVDSTSYHYNKEDRVIFYEEKNNSIKLNENDLRQIIEEVLKIEESFGHYTEIEWNFTEGNLYILQAKKIKNIDTNADTIILNNRDIVDKFPGVILPLTESFARKSYAEVLKNITNRTLPGEEILKNYQDRFDKMIYCVNGRMYCNIKNWNLFLQFIPMGSKVLLSWQRKMGLLEGKKEKAKKGFERKLKGGQISKIEKNSAKLFKNNKTLMEKYINDFDLLYESFTRRFRKDMSNMELVLLYEEYVAEALKDFDLTFINEIYVYSCLELLKEKLKKVKIENNDKFITEYISDIYNNETEKFLRDLFEIASMVDEKIEEKLKTLNTNPKAREYIYEDNPFSAKLRAYMIEYGNIVLDSLKLESKTFKSDPKLLIEKILEYTKNKDKAKSVQGSLINYENKDIHLVVKKHAGIFLRSDINKLEKICREVVGFRESTKKIRAKLYDMVRLIFNTISKNLYNDGLIFSTSDIFYLQIDEVIECIKGKSIDLKKLSLERRKEYICYYKLPSYSTLEFSNGIYNKYHVNINYFGYDETKKSFEGEAYSAGIVKKEVVVVYTKEDLKDIEDKIIIARTTDFGWFLDIAFSAGLITEYGSMLSGTSILARDLKIPYVSGIKNATAVFRTGQIVELDGNTGKITVINEEKKVD